jgi:putative ATP-dependent endonuclease of OLD family
VRLQEVRIEGYRCLENVTLDFGALTVLLGSNSTGKSSVLKALRFFFEGERLSPEDVFNGNPEGRVAVQATFGQLTDADRAVFGQYATGEQMVLRRTWQGDETKITGRGLRYPGFDAIRQLSGAAERRAYQELHDAQPEMGLTWADSVAAARDAMQAWEMGHPERCETTDHDAGRFFGFSSVGQNRLSDRFKFVFVAGLRDAADEATERKGTILERLLAAIADQRADADGGLAEMGARWREEYDALVETFHRPTLDGLAERLSEQMRRYVPSAEISLQPEPRELSIEAPRVLLRGGEEKHLTDLGRQGHGFQRTFIIAALEYLASVQEDGDRDRPTLFLAIEEPELYQHPPRAMHFARTLRDLTSADAGSVQVCYATHSPYFVSPSDFGAVRICRRDPHPDGESSAPTKLTAADVQRVEQLLPAGDRKQVERRLSTTLRSGFPDAFFARAVLLVEGPTDIAVFSEAARMTGCDLASNGVVAVGVSKSVIPVAYAILNSLGVPAYVVFDGDHVEEPSEACEQCGRGGRDPSNDALQNRRILELLGAAQADFPDTQHHDRWACFSLHMESYLSESIPTFDEMTRETAARLNWRPKTPEVYVEVLAQLGADSLPEMLVEVPRAVLSLCETASSGSGGSVASTLFGPP